MASQKRVSFSQAELSLNDIESHYESSYSSIKLYFSKSNPEAESIFAGKSSTEIAEELAIVAEENERMISLNLLSCIEAAFRVDYLQRSYARKRDSLSQAFVQLHQEKGNRASLEDEILDAWKAHTSISNQIISDLKSAFRYRHWLAHGRYWTPKLGRKYDYFSVYTLGQIVFNNMPLTGHEA